MTQPNDPSSGIPKPALTGEGNLFDFFHARVSDARSETGLQISPDTELYLASLLADRARSDRPGRPEQTLAELHARAAGSPPGSQASTYRELGDRALLLLGFFREHLDRARRPVGPAYYEDMGAAAYHHVDLVLKRWFSDAFGPVFEELAQGFKGCAEVLGVVRSRTPASAEGPHADSLLAAYGRWLDGGGRGDAATLYAGGLILPREPTDET